jgi:hypothetical protein
VQYVLCYWIFSTWCSGWSGAFGCDGDEVGTVCSFCCASNTFFERRLCNLALLALILAKILVCSALCFISPLNMVWMSENWFSNRGPYVGLPLETNLALIPKCYVNDFINTQQDNLIGFEGT